MTIIKNIVNFLKDTLLARKWKGSSKGSKIDGVILMYHHITDEYVDINLSCRCPIKVFEHYLDEYISRGYKFVSIDEAYSIIVGDGAPFPFCVLTFDDIPDNVYLNAYPILQKRGIPFTIFVSSNFVDYYDPEKKIQFITRDHLLEMDKDPLCTVGAHTVSHPMLKKVKNSFEEMKENKDWLENILGHPVDYLAYPYGKHSSINKRIQKQASLTGFKCAFSSIDAPVNDISSRHLFFLPRLVRN